MKRVHRFVEFRASYDMQESAGVKYLDEVCVLRYDGYAAAVRIGLDLCFIRMWPYGNGDFGIAPGGPVQ